MKAIFAHTPEEIEKILELRFKILREPWGQSKESSSDGHEDTSQNAFVEDDKGNVIACGRLQTNDANTGQVRYMAVANGMQGKGLGKLVLKTLEEKAKELGLKKIELQARENALEFYKANNYLLKEKTHLLFGVVQHYLMEKEL
ncbi:MAG: GNAT family N-acetyltransferase [Sphingobacteriaceae bacterium]|nr:GNAT family N-acetyltransferase [Sphingobacteriaceae bacterium]MBK7817323.1 GNAT family N-acetyltransferase [Sphingobacteriaceae bacterium]